MRYSGEVLAARGVLAGFMVVQTAGFVCPHTSLAISTPSRICVSSSTFFTSVSTVSHRGRIFAPPSTLPSAATPPRNRSGRPGRRPGGALRARRPLSRRDDYDDGLDADFDDDYFYDEDELMGGRGVPPIGGRRQRKSKVSLLPSQISKALVAGVFVLGIGTGVTVDSAINTDPRDLASRDAIDRNAPNPNICQTYGSSAMVVDQRVFVTFNPFSLHVSQADTKPGCVLRPANVVEVLQRKRNLLTQEDVETCKGGMNTWGFVGDLNDHPQLSCVYQSDDAQNEFLSNPKYGLGEDVYDDDRAAAAKKAGPQQPANGPRVMANTVKTERVDM